MNIEYIDPFIIAAMNVIKTMAFCDPKVGKPLLKKNDVTWGVVTGIIGMAGNEVAGNMVLSFDQGSILKIVSNMLGESFSTLSNDVVDAVGELTNMITGGAKAKFSEKGLKFDMAIPLMVVGKDIQLKQLSKAPTVTIPFEIPEGRFVIEANLAKKG